MSRDKENTPFTSSQRVNGSIPSLSKTPPSEDFFTDSLLDVSRIPSPSPQKIGLSKPRRAAGNARVLQLARRSGNVQGQPTTSEKHAGNRIKQSEESPKVKRRKSPSPRPNNPLSTPPQSSHGLELRSPTSDLSSPPHELPDVYQRIADEEDLAATEGEMGSDEDIEEEFIPETYDVREHISPLEELKKSISPEDSRESSTTTPVQSQTAEDKDNYLEERMESMSETTGLSFLNQMTDQELAAKLTPHIVDRSRDRARINAALNGQKPILFEPKVRSPSNIPQQYGVSSETKASMLYGKPVAFSRARRRALREPGKAYSDTSTEEYPSKRLTAFGRAGKRKSNGVRHHLDDDSDTPDELKEREKLVAFGRATRTLFGRKANIEESKADEMGDRPSNRLLLDKKETHIPIPETHLELHKTNGVHDAENNAPSGNSNHHGISNQRSGSVSKSRRSPLIVAGAGREVFDKWRQKGAEHKVNQPEDPPVEHSSQVDWGETGAADIPIRSIEKDSDSRSTTSEFSRRSSSVREQGSAEKTRRWENDFTGTSFQVSESPPVRSKSSASDYVREKEIQSLTRQAVTTNRLDEIRGKDPREQGRGISRSPSISRGSVTKEDGSISSAQPKDLSIINEDEQLHKPWIKEENTSTENARVTNSDSTPRPGQERQEAHEYLQRLARAMSNTPRSNLAPEPLSRDDAKESPSAHKKTQIDGKPDSDFAKIDHDPVQRTSEVESEKNVAETPRVMGAWTDTILPDTVRTVKPNTKSSKYAQTPQIHAGGWVETPLPTGLRQSSALAPMTIDEIPEEIVEEIKQEALQEDSKQQVLGPSELKAVEIPKSSLKNVIDRASQQSAKSEEGEIMREDTLNLGDDTYASFDDLVDSTVDDFTMLIRLRAEKEVHDHPVALEANDGDPLNNQVEFLDRLGLKLERLRTNIHDTRKAVSRMEREVSNAPESAVAPIELDATCPTCHQVMDGHVHGTSDHLSIPIVYSTITLPIPLLFHPRKKIVNPWVPRPTLFGWTMIILWLWYLIENTMCEIYCRPLYAESYSWPSEPEPVYPYVLPTMLWKWTRMETIGPYTLGPVWTLLVAFYRIVGMWIGYTDGFADDLRPGVGRSLFENATQAVLKAAQTVASGIEKATGEGLDLSMMNDEFI